LYLFRIDKASWLLGDAESPASNPSIADVSNRKDTKKPTVVLNGSSAASVAAVSLLRDFDDDLDLQKQHNDQLLQQQQQLLQQQQASQEIYIYMFNLP